MIFDVKIEKRENFDAMTERETISIQNIDFRDIAKLVKIDCFDVTNEIRKNELSKIDFNWSINDVNIKIDSFDVKNVAKNVDVVIIIFDVDFEIVMILTNSLDINVAKNVDFAIDTMNIRFAIIVFDIKKIVNIAFIDFDVIFANFFW